MSTKKDYKPRVIPADKTQVNFNLKTETHSKIKAIAGKEGVSTGEILNIAADRFVTAYEEKNGRVRVRPKGSGLEGI